MALTEKKRRFVAALQSGLTGAKAAVDAGYSEKGAAQAASRLMKDGAVVSALGRALEVNKTAPVNKSKFTAPPPPNGFTTPAGTKTPSAPADWPFGMEPPPAPPPPPAAAPEDLPKRYDDPRDFLVDLMNDIGADPKERLDAAKALLPFEHARLAPKGKKEALNDAAKKPSRFGAAAPPRLATAGGKPV